MESSRPEDSLENPVESPEGTLENCEETKSPFPGIDIDQFKALVEEFTAAATNEERMRVTSTYLAALGPEHFIEQCFQEIKDQTIFKSKEKAEQFRTEGNTMFRNGDHQKALELYTKSIAYAPLDSGELCLAFGNRSAVLRYTKRCRECVVDIERALSHGYPVETSFNLTEEERTTLQQQLDAEKQAPCKKTCPEKVIFPTEVPTLSYGANPEVLGASSAVRIEYSEQQGRHLVATRDIEIGDVVLISENSVVTVMDRYIYNHCAQCHKPCCNLIPCSNCVLVLFCSEDCQTKAGSKYHNAECIANSRFQHITDKQQGFNGRYDRVIRLLAIIGIDKLEPYFKYARVGESDEDKRTRGFNSDGVFDPSNLDIIFNLGSKVEQRDQANFMIFSLFTLQIPRCFGMSMTDPDFLAVAGLCLLLQDTAMVSHFPKAYFSFESCIPPMKFNLVASCFNPLSSLVKYACISNLSNVAYGNKSVYTAKWPIVKGTMLTASMYYYDVRVPKLWRQDLYKKTGFPECKCDACVNDWPLEDTQMLISDPEDKLTARKFTYGHDFIVQMHQIFPVSCLAPEFDEFLKRRYQFLTKMWNKKEFLDALCFELQRQVDIYKFLQGNRVISTMKNSLLPDHEVMKSSIAQIEFN
ncbi:hypothetical protein B566_EDAN016991 [Ephemera danica]|nr:hypothetical protein B566_EDAN016991 [Ephemera danica]